MPRIFIPKVKLKSHQYPRWSTATLCHKNKCIRTLRKKTKKNPNSMNVAALQKQKIPFVLSSKKQNPILKEMLHDCAVSMNINIYKYISYLKRMELSQPPFTIIQIMLQRTSTRQLYFIIISTQLLPVLANYLRTTNCLLSTPLYSFSMTWMSLKFCRVWVHQSLWELMGLDQSFLDLVLLLSISHCIISLAMTLTHH